jgi:hypothetical protein
LRNFTTCNQLKMRPKATCLGTAKTVDVIAKVSICGSLNNCQ